MLTHIHIKGFTLVDKLELELHKGLTVMTGETGAGKSIMLDALALALGDRADADKVRPGSKKADIQASFDIVSLDFAKRWLEEHELAHGDECILRRVVTADGRSRAYINGHTVTLAQLRTLGERLIDIHSQHEHQSLLKTSTHQRLLDEFGNLRPLARQVRQAFKQWSQVVQQLSELKSQSAEVDARFQLLSYQVEELNQLALQEGELEQLEQEQQTLANAEQINRNCQQVGEICSNDEEGLLGRLHSAVHLLDDLAGKPAGLDEASELLRNAIIQVQEAQREIDRYLDRQGDDDLYRLPQIEERLSAIYEIARKHRVPPEELVSLHADLQRELDQLQGSDEQIEELEARATENRKAYQQLADELSEKRRFAATRLAKAVNGKLHQLAMEHARFEPELKTELNEPSASGNEEVEFLISTNPGQPPKPLIKIASGGELSRVSLAIQVVTAQTSTIPTLIFDEVDVGIGGTTGDVVGHLLRELGEKGQAICVTHLAQVASKGHQHLLVSKSVSKTAASSSVTLLKGEEKVAEIARMMGGDTDSAQSLAHAKEMLQVS